MKVNGATPVNVIVRVVELPRHISASPLIIPVGLGKYVITALPEPVFVHPVASETETIVYVPARVAFIVNEFKLVETGGWFTPFIAYVKSNGAVPVSVTFRGRDPPSQTVPPFVMLAVGNGLTFTENGLWFVTHPAMLVSRTRIVPPTFPNTTVIVLAEGSPIMAAPPGKVQLYTDPVLPVTR